MANIIMYIDTLEYNSIPDYDHIAAHLEAAMSVSVSFAKLEVYYARSIASSSAGGHLYSQSICTLSSLASLRSWKV